MLIAAHDISPSRRASRTQLRWRHELFAVLVSLVSVVLSSASNPWHDPVAASGAIVNSSSSRITVLRPGLFRLQLGRPHDLDDRPTFQVVNRRSPVPPFRDISNELPRGSLGVATAVANLSVQSNGLVTFGCEGRMGWQWNMTHPGNQSPSAVEHFGMPISRRGVYILDDSDTARLGGGDSNTIAWWQLPKVASSHSPPAPAPTPPPADTCANIQVGIDCAPNQATVKASLANQTQASCCAACNADKSKPGTGLPCVAWVWGPLAPGDHGTNCWLQSSCRATVKNPARTFGGSADWPPLPPPPPPSPVDLYFLCYGNDHQEGMRQLTTITGSAPLLPLAAYGVWYSGCCIPDLYNSTAVRTLLLAEYSRQDLPLDVFVFDFFWHRRNGWGGYSWDRTHFPDGEALFASMRDGTNPYGAPIKTLNNHHPNGYVITPAGEDRYDAFAEAMGAEPAKNQSFPCDFYNRTYISALQTTMLAGVEDYPWIDCVSCSVHGDCGKHPGAPPNLDFNLLTNYAFDAQFTLMNRRSLTLNRLPGRGDGSNYNDQPLNGSQLVGNLGAHRYPGAWTGDVGDGLQDLAHSVSLFPAAFAGHFWGSYSVDLGPYADGLDQYTFPTNGVRYVRYMQWGVWTSIFRPHDGGNDDTRIWMFAAPYAAILRDCTRLRGALTPYVYTLAAKASNESWPFSRPMWWDYGYNVTTGSEVDEAWSVSSQYLFGDVLVNPVTDWVDPQSSTMNTTALTAENKTTWLPAGVAWSSWDGHVRWSAPSEGTFITTEAKLADTPLFVRQGAVVAMWPPGRRATAPPDRTKVFAIWTAAKGSNSSGSGIWYEDDGETLDYHAGPSGHARSVLSWVQTSTGHITVNISSPTKAVAWLPHNYRTFAVQLRGVTGGSLGRVQVCHSSDPGSTPTKCTDLTPTDNPSADPEWTLAGWWLQGANGAESAVPEGTAVVVLPPLGLHSVASLQVELL